MAGMNVRLGRYWVHVDYEPDYKPGDPPPTGYLDWHAWASVQHKAGLRQFRCSECGKMHYPQERAACTPQRREGEG